MYSQANEIKTENKHTGKRKMFILWHKKKIKFTKTKFNVKYNLIYKTQILLFINYFLSKAIFLGYKPKSKQGYTCDWTENALNVKIFKIVTSFCTESSITVVILNLIRPTFVSEWAWYFNNWFSKEDFLTIQSLHIIMMWIVNVNYDFFRQK